VIAVPDDTLGERVHAVIVPEPGVATDLDDLRRHCRGLIADYEAQRSCEFVDSLALSPIGKPLKRELRRRHWAGMDRQVTDLLAAMGHDACRRRRSHSRRCGRWAGCSASARNAVNAALNASGLSWLLAWPASGTTT
jgi:hypothetical protein